MYLYPKVLIGLYNLPPKFSCTSSSQFKEMSSLQPSVTELTHLSSLNLLWSIIDMIPIGSLYPNRSPKNSSLKNHINPTLPKKAPSKRHPKAASDTQNHLKVSHFKMHNSPKGKPKCMNATHKVTHTHLPDITPPSYKKSIPDKKSSAAMKTT